MSSPYSEIANPGWKKILDLFRGTTLANGKCPDPHSLVLCIDQATELELLSLQAWELGERVVSDIVFDGVRCAFDTILGFQVKWDAKELCFAKRKAE